MPWRCPACQQPIQHTELESRPRPGAPYRCHICRLELHLDEHDKLAVVSMGEADDRDRRTDPKPGD